LFTSSCQLIPLSCSFPPVISCLFLVHFLLSTHASFLFTSSCQLMPISCSLPPVIICFFIAHRAFCEFLILCHLLTFFQYRVVIPNKIILCNIQYLPCVSLSKKFTPYLKSLNGLHRQQQISLSDKYTVAKKWEHVFEVFFSHCSLFILLGFTTVTS
jgi:hypothetical protein